MGTFSTTLTRGRLAAHPLWGAVLASPALAARLVLPVVVSAAVEDRETVEGTLAGARLERLSLTELVREARAAAQAGIGGLLIFGVADRKDEDAVLATQRDHIFLRAIRAVKEAVPDLAVMSDVCVCGHTAHGQCVLFAAGGGADVAATLERLAEIALVHADAGADLILLSSMLDGAAGAVRGALDANGHAGVPVAATAALESVLYQVQRRSVGAVPVQDRAVPLLASDDPSAARARARRDVAAGADAIVVTPGAPGLDVVARLTRDVTVPVIAHHTADEHALYAAAEGEVDALAIEHELVTSSRRAGADLIITHAALGIAELF